MNVVEPTVRKVESYIEGFFWVLPNLGLALVVFLLFLGGAALAKRAVIGVAQRRDRGNLGTLLGGFVRWAVILLGLLVVATIVFPSVKPADVLATLGVGSVAIGFAFKDILQNWLSGLLILYRQPFRTGDQIKSGEFEGTVERVEARATLIKTYDGQRVVIPNSDIYTRAVTVRTAFPKRRSEYDVGIGYGDDVEEACRVIAEALGQVEGVEKEPAPEAFAWALDASSVNVKVRWWSESHRVNVVHVQGRAIAAIKKALSEAGIDLPFPTRVVLLHDQTEESDGDRTRQREGWPAGDRPPRPRHLNEVELRCAGGSGVPQERGAGSSNGDDRERVGVAEGERERDGPAGHARRQEPEARAQAFPDADRRALERNDGMRASVAGRPSELSRPAPAVTSYPRYDHRARETRDHARLENEA